MLRLWGRATSSNVMKVIWTLEELGLSYERIDVGGPFGGTDTPQYRAMNPPGLVPTLEEDGGFTMFESNAIIRHICRAHAPGTTLWPDAVRARAKVDQWMDCQGSSVRPLSTVFQGLVRVPPEKRDMAAIKQAMVDAGRVWSMVDTAIAANGWIAGDTLTLADIVWGVHVHRWFGLPIDPRPDLPHLRGWYDRLLERPAYKAHCAGAIV